MTGETKARAKENHITMKGRNGINGRIIGINGKIRKIQMQTKEKEKEKAATIVERPDTNKRTVGKHRKAKAKDYGPWRTTVGTAGIKKSRKRQAMEMNSISAH